MVFITDYAIHKYMSEWNHVLVRPVPSSPVQSSPVQSRSVPSRFVPFRQSLIPNRDGDMHLTHVNIFVMEFCWWVFFSITGNIWTYRGSLGKYMTLKYGCKPVANNVITSHITQYYVPQWYTYVYILHNSNNRQHAAYKSKQFIWYDTGCRVIWRFMKRVQESNINVLENI